MRSNVQDRDKSGRCGDTGNVPDAKRRVARPVVLIVDPDQDARDLYGNWFTSIGYDVMSAAAVEWACWATRRHRPDLIVTELQLHNGTGVELLHALRRPCEPPIPTLVITRTGDADLRIAARDAGAVAVLEKFASWDDLRMWIAALAMPSG